jgi:CRP-like cAMP-binding protein
MPSRLVRKLELFTRLSQDDKQAIAEATNHSQREFGPREDITLEGDKPIKVHLVVEGWACRYKYLEDGRRQISGILLPGDLCDAGLFIFKQLDFSLGTLSVVKIAEIPRPVYESLSASHPRIEQALHWNASVEQSIAREWITNLGQRTAPERLAHLFCELYVRLHAVGLAEAFSFELPITQEQLADVVGMSNVHVNRSLMQLRDEGLITLHGRVLTIHDFEGLQSLALFDAAYLHFDHEGQALDANDV